MNTERNIIARLLEGVDPSTIEKKECLDEAEFEYNGKVFKTAFGRYSADGEPISRDDYFKAKEMVDKDKGPASKGNSPKSSNSERKIDYDNKLNSLDLDKLYKDSKKSSQFGGPKSSDAKLDAKMYKTLQGIKKKGVTLDSATNAFDSLASKSKKQADSIYYKYGENMGPDIRKVYNKHYDNYYSNLSKIDDIKRFKLTNQE